MILELTEVARKAISSYLDKKKFILDKKTKEAFNEKRASFVTLTKKEHLRGCIGSLEARQELWKDVQENAVNSAFYDSRFPPLTKKEFKDIKIEISVLSEPIKLEFENPEDLINKIENHMGLILRKGMYSATFLPQVWEQIPDKKQFLEELSLKAGLDVDEWKNAEIWYYIVERYEEL